MRLVEYAEVLWRWGWVIILVTGLCGAAAIGFGQIQTPRYTSLVELTVMPARIDQGLSQTVINLFHNYASAIRSQGMARRVVEVLGLSDVNPLELQPRITAEPLPAEYKIAIEATDWDPVLAQRIAQTTAELFAGDVAAYSAGLDPLDRLSVTLLNNGAQPANRTWPRNKLLAFLGVGGGLMAGLLTALRLEWLRLEALRTPEEVEEASGLTVVGRIPGSRPARRWDPRRLFDRRVRP
jgi:uncharacterized protein involved in exopolysaccharide biosynthesis